MPAVRLPSLSREAPCCTSCWTGSQQDACRAWVDLERLLNLRAECHWNPCSFAPPGLSPDGKYSTPWLLRARLLAAMGAKSMKSLEVMESDSLDLVKKSFPDAKEWLEL